MNEPRVDRHPLDRDDAEDAISSKRPPAAARAHQPLLRASVKVVIGSFAVCFVAGLISVNAAPNSTLESIASTAHRLGLIALLIAFCAILVAYRLPQLNQNSIPRKRPMPRDRLFGPGFAALVALNVLGSIMALGVLLSFSIWLGPLLVGLFTYLSAISAGLLVTIAIWHSGYLRAYAIGTLAVLVMSTQSSGMSFLYMASMSGSMRAMSNPWPLAIQILIAPFTGVLCAGYVCLLEHMRKPPMEDSTKT